MRFSKAIITGLVVNLLLVNARPIQEDVSIESGLQTTDLNSFVIRARPGKKKDPVPATPRPVTPGPATEPEGDVMLTLLVMSTIETMWKQGWLTVSR
jgi:hypothetical protein